MSDRLATAYAVFLFVVVPLVVIFAFAAEIAGPVGVLAAAAAGGSTWYVAGRTGGDE